MAKKERKFWVVSYLDISSENLDGKCYRKEAYYDQRWYTPEEAVRKTKQLPNVRDVRDPFEYVGF